MRKLIILYIGILFFACVNKQKSDFNFYSETGITEDEYYEFLNSTYSQRLDTLSSSRDKILYSYVAWSIKIEFENGMPTELEPPGVDFKSIKTYKLDSVRLENFRLISPETYAISEKEMLNNNCTEFDSKIGDYIVFLHLPWYNPGDSSLLIREVLATCPPHYHQGEGVLFRYKKKAGNWTINFE